MTATLEGPDTAGEPQGRTATTGAIAASTVFPATLPDLLPSPSLDGAFPLTPARMQIPEPAPVTPAAPVPVHCGQAMTLQRLSITGVAEDALIEPSWPIWYCSCGFRMDAEVSEALDTIWAAAAAVESRRWELDTAMEKLETALQRAASSGLGIRELQHASGLPATDITAILKASK